MVEEVKHPETIEERQSIDAINFALLCFLAADDNGIRGLRDLLDQYTKLELSRGPFYRRMRILVDEGYVNERVVDEQGTVLYSLTDKGKQHAIEWAHTMQLLGSMALYCLEYTQTEEYANETK